MQKTLLFVLGAFLVACSSTGKLQPSKYSMPNSSTIILRVDEAPAAAYQHLCDYIQQQGFSIVQENVQKHTLTTDYRPERHYRYCLRAVVAQDSMTHIDLTGLLKDHEGNTRPIEKANMSSLQFSAWIQMHKLASGFHAREMYFSE